MTSRHMLSDNVTDLDGEAIFDRTKLLYNTEGDEALASMLVDVFLETVPSSLAAVRAAIAAGDARELRSAAHSFKGSAGTVTAKRVAAAAQALEKCGADAGLDDAPRLLSHLETALAELQAYLGAAR